MSAIGIGGPEGGQTNAIRSGTGADTALALFRPAALEHLRRPEQIGRAMQLVRPPYRAILWLIGAALVVCVGASAVVKVPLMITAPGMALHASETMESTVLAQHDGMLASVTVKVGDRVEIGDVIATVAQPILENDLRLAQDENTSASERLQHVRKLQALTFANLEPLHAHLAEETAESIGRMTKRQADLTQLLANNEKLRDKGLITVDRFLLIRSQLAEALDAISTKKASLINLQVDWAEKQNQFARETVELEDKIAHTRRQIERVEAQLRQATVVKAAQAGQVGEVKLAAGDLVRFNSPVVGLVPVGTATGSSGQDALIAVALIPVTEGKKVSAGDAAFVDPASVRRDLYGQIRARVTTVSGTPATPERLRNLLRNDDLVRKMAEAGPSFMATITLERSAATPSGYAWTSSKGPDGKLTAGTPLRVEIEIERVALLALLMPALKQMLRMDPRH